MTRSDLFVENVDLLFEGCGGIGSVRIEYVDLRAVFDRWDDN